MQRPTYTGTFRIKFYSFILTGLVTLLILLSCAGNSNIAAQQTEAEEEARTKTAEDILSVAPGDTLSVVAVGDMMLGSAYKTPADLPKDDARGSFKNVRPYLKADIVFGNLEGCLLNDGKSTKCKDTVGNSCFAFRMPERYGPVFKDAGFNFLSVANNHVGDFGSRGRMRTAAILDSLQINHAGLLSHPYSFFEKDSVKYAFCAFSPSDYTLSINSIDSAKQVVSFLKTQADIVIVSFHGGGEGAAFEHVTRANEVFYQENRGDVYAFSHAVIDAGADLVLGHGPHVTRAVEVYRNKFIAYSLGNFCTYGHFNLSGPNGFAPILKIKMNRQGDFLYADVTSVKQTKPGRLTLDSSQTAFKKMAALTAQDFPENQLSFSNRKIRLK